MALSATPPAAAVSCKSTIHLKHLIPVKVKYFNEFFQLT